jgi:hypothetical protein
MLDDEATTTKQRRNVIVIATGLLAYHLAGGGLKRVPIPGDWITFARPGVFLVFAWLALAYSLLRYLQHAMPQLRSFGEGFAATTTSESGIREYLWRRVSRGKKFPDSARDSYLISAAMRAPKAFVRFERQIKIPDPPVGPPGSSILSVSDAVRGERIPLHIAWFYETKQFAIQAMLYPTILELWFPFVLSFVAVMVALFQSFVLTASPWTRLLDRFFY